MSYQKADFAPLRETGYGIGFHWTTWTAPRSGEPLPFPEAVEAFPVEALVEQAVECGAGHVLFPVTHALHWIPGPNPEVDRLIAGRTCERDLIMEVADALAVAGIKLLIYYHHGTDLGSNDDPEWQEACGARLPDQSRFYDNYCRILSWMGEHYGSKVLAFWFDAGYALEARPPTPWERMTAAAKAGHAGRLVCYNSGIDNFHAYTPYQDYWAGEVNGLRFRPSGPLTPSGLYWYSFTAPHTHPQCPEWGLWGLDMSLRDGDYPAPPAPQIADFLRSFQACGGTVSLNLLVYQDGSLYDADLGVMREVKRLMQGAG